MDRYISFKDGKKHNLAFAARQDTAASVSYFFLSKRDTSARPSKVLFEKRFENDAFAAARDLYRTELIEMLNG